MEASRKISLTRLFIALWILLQVSVPFVQKFGFPPLRYRYARFSWAMYSRPPLLYEVSLYGETAGEKRPITGIERYVRGYKSPDPMPMRDLYGSVEEVEDRFARLVTFIAQDRRDGQRYTASIRWIRSLRPEVSPRWEFVAEAKP